VLVVLCTDGEPTSCEGLGTTDVFARTIAAETSAAAKGVKTYVISLASSAESAQYQNFLDQLADIGNPGTPAFFPATASDLSTKIKDIVRRAFSCTTALKGKVSIGEACRDTVMLNSEKLACEGADGWKLTDESRIELQGKACTDLKNNVTAKLSAIFPCDAVLNR
jgi:hypothetical protein